MVSTALDLGVAVLELLLRECRESQRTLERAGLLLAIFFLASWSVALTSPGMNSAGA